MDETTHETVTIREAREEDQPALRELFRQGVVEGQVPDNDTGADIDNLREGYFADDGNSGFWVAVLDGAVVGMVGVQYTRADCAEIRRLRVSTGHRRRGIGTQLMKQALTFCQHHGYLKVILDVRIERGPAIALFRNFGFELARTRELDGRKMLDFYMDLYREPGIAEE